MQTLCYRTKQISTSRILNILYLETTLTNKLIYHYLVTRLNVKNIVTPVKILSH